MKRRILAGHANVTTADPAVFNQPRGNEFRRVNSRRKADALCRQDDRCIHTDDLAGCRDEWASGITWIQRGVGLNDIVDEPAGLRSERDSGDE